MKYPLRLLLAMAGLWLSALPLAAKDVPFNVLPWNGYKGAMSLTYDDGDPIHLDLVIPEMNKRGLRGTFYLITSKLDRVDDWKKAAASGQEIGNHTVTHRHVNELKPEDEKDEVVEAKAKLGQIFGKPALTLAYPFVEISPGLKKWVEAEDFAARGGGNSFLTPDMDPDWYNIPGMASMTAYAYDTYKGWVDQALASGAWSVLMIHGIEGTPWGWQPITKKTFLQFLDYVAQQKKDLWVAPFGEVCAYWRAQKTLEKAEPQKDGMTTVIKWQKPANFPGEVQVKLVIQGDGLKVSQKGQTLRPAGKDIYAVSFDAGELTLVNAAWKPEAAHGSAAPVEAKAAVIDSGSVVSAPAKDVLKVDDFESGTPAFGGGWWEGSDSNGITKLSPNPFTALSGGSPVSPGHSAGMKGHMAPMQAPWPWAVLSENLDAGGKPVDLSAYKAIRFYTQGDGKAHAVALNKASVTDYCDFQATYPSPKDWTKTTINFTELAQPTWGKQLEKKFNDVLKLTFTPNTPDGDFDFKVDDIEFLR